MQEIFLTTYNEDVLWWETVRRRPAGPLCRTVEASIDCPSDALKGIKPEDKHDHSDLKLNCKDILCYACSMPITYALAHKAYERLIGVQNEFYKRGFELRQYHFILSPPEADYYEFATIKGYKRITKKAIVKMRKLGVAGGEYCLHRIRGNDQKIKDYQRHKIKLKDSWHWHNVGLGAWVPIIEPGYEDTWPEGWHYSDGYDHNHPALVDDDDWVFIVKDIIETGGAWNVIDYELKHAAVYRRGYNYDARLSNVVRPMGILSPRYSESKPYVEDLERACKVCGRHLVRHVDGYGLDDATLHRRHRRYTIRPDQLALAARKYALPSTGVERGNDLSVYSAESLSGHPADN